jgi:hypothetical protein
MTNPPTETAELASWLCSFSPTALREGERDKCVEAGDRLLTLSSRVRVLEEALTEIIDMRPKGSWPPTSVIAYRALEARTTEEE